MTTEQVTPAVRLTLFDEAADANHVLFRHGGLTVLAPPLRYSFSHQLSRIQGAVVDRERRIASAATYLRRLIQEQGAPVSRVHINTWLDDYGFQYNEADATEVDNVYQQAHLAHAIV